MKKRQKKSKVEVVETKSVPNRRDYCRDNGKCGRALSDMFSKPCLGRSCVDWDCEAEDDSGEAVSSPLQAVKRCDGMRDDGTCGNGCSDNHNNKCRGAKCQDRFNYGDAEETPSAVVPANASRRDGGGTEVAVVEPVGGAVGMTEQDIAAGISRQCTIIEEAEKNAEHERIKLGIVLIRWEQYLGESRGGRGKSGQGLKGWLEANVPKLKYNTALCYKQQAERAITMSGGGAHAQAALMGEPTVTQPNGDVIDVDATYVKKANEVIENADSRRKLEQQYFEFMAKQGKKRQGGANKGQSGTGSRALTAEEKSESADVEIRQLIGKIIAFDKGEKFRMLTAQTQSDIILALKDVVKSFEEQQS